MKALLLLFVIVGLVCGVALGRDVRVSSHQEMLEKSDVVVIAKPVASQDTNEVTEGRTNWPAMVGVTTTFDVLSVLKGDKTLKQFKVSHFRLRQAADEVAIIDGPGLLKLDLKEGHAYFLYLTRGPDGRYTPFSGQTDPDFSVFKLVNAVH